MSTTTTPNLRELQKFGGETTSDNRGLGLGVLWVVGDKNRNPNTSKAGWRAESLKVLLVGRCSFMVNSYGNN